MALYFTHYRSHAVNVLILHSKAFLLVGKPIYVAAYGIVSYTEAFFYLIFEGIALGTQPLISFTTGADLKERVTKFRNLTFIITLLIAVIGVITVYSIPEIIIYIFAEDNLALQPEAIKGISLYFWGLPFEGLFVISRSNLLSSN